MATMTFKINDSSTSSANPAVWVTITENGNGTLTFQVTQEGGIIGDLRGIFFDVADESILGSLKVMAVSTDIRIGDDAIKDLGDGANMNGLLGSDKGYDVGIEVGAAGIKAAAGHSKHYLVMAAEELVTRQILRSDSRLDQFGLRQVTP